MHELEKLKNMLCEELEKHADKGELTAGSLEVVDKLAHAIKNLDKIIENYDGEYSGRYMPRYMYDDGNSYARKRDSMGRYSREYSRENRGGYSREYSRDGIADKLRELMDDAPDEKTRNEIRKLADKMETM